MMESFDNFISKSPFKTPPGTLQVTSKGQTIESKQVPAGFDLLRYAMIVYDNERNGFEMNMNRQLGMLVVNVQEEGDEIASLKLVYDEKTDARTKNTLA